MAVNLTPISDLETRNGDDPFAGVVANRAGGTDEEIYEQEESTVNSFPGIVGRSAAGFRSPEFTRITRITRFRQKSPHFTAHDRR